MLEACRTCLRLINIDSSPFYEIEADDIQLSAESCRYKLLSIVPEMALNVTPKSMLCTECFRSLKELCEFREKCLETENIIVQYFKTKDDLDMENIDLKDVSSFYATNINIIGDRSVGVKLEGVTVKEELELSDIAIVKHEIDDRLLESVEAARISEEEAVTVLINDVAVKKKMELSDTVITNVRRKVNNFTSKSVEVMRPKNAVPGSNLICEYCKMRCKNSKSLKKHLRTHTGEKTYHCEICDRRFVRKYNLSLHLRTHAGIRPYLCNVCGMAFASNSMLMIHMRTHTGEKPYICEICDHGFKRKHDLTEHLRTHTGDKPYRCETCDRSFSRKSHLSTHLRIHSGERPYVCTVCNKGCLTKYSLKVHMRFHTGEKLYRCEICDHRFTIKYELTVHLRTHTGERPYQCELCDCSFKRKSHLSTHIGMHRGERPYVCTVCGKGYTSSFNLKKHLCTLDKEHPHQRKKNSSLVNRRKKRSPSKSFQCEHCKDIFCNNHHLQEHIMKMHKNVDVNMVFVKCENTSHIDQTETQHSIIIPLAQ